MKKTDAWLGSEASTSFSRGSHYRDSGPSYAGLSRVIVVLVVLAIIVAVVQMLRPVPMPKAQSSLSSGVIPGTPPSLPWPSTGGGQVQLQNIGVIGSFNPSAQFPLASVAKIVTALVVTKDHPLALGATGPSFTISASDAATYKTMHSQQDSVMAVVAGEKLTEYQLLEALLIPSADNIAILLANWDAGSVSAFVTKMNAMAKSLGMTQTVFKDPSGLDTGTVGTAGDQVTAALALLKNPLLAKIVSQPQATLPVVGVVYNVNYDVTHDGFVGVKTGSMGNDANLVFAATGGGSKDLIVGAILGQSGSQPLKAALTESTKLVDAARKVPSQFSVLKQNQEVGSISAPGAEPIPVEASQGVTVVGWPGMKVGYAIKFQSLPKTIAKGTKVGTLTVTVGEQTKTVSLVTGGSVKAPSVAWRLRRL